MASPHDIAEELRQLIKEAHGVTRDNERLIKRLSEFTEHKIKAEVERIIEATVNQEIKTISDYFDNEILRVTKSMLTYFEKLRISILEDLKENPNIQTEITLSKKGKPTRTVKAGDPSGIRWITHPAPRGTFCEAPGHQGDDKVPATNTEILTGVDQGKDLIWEACGECHRKMFDVYKEG